MQTVSALTPSESPNKALNNPVKAIQPDYSNERSQRYSKPQFDVRLGSTKRGILNALATNKYPLAFSKMDTETDEDAIFVGFEWESGLKIGPKIPTTSTSREQWNVIAKERTEYYTRLGNSPLMDYVNMRTGGTELELVSIPATIEFHKSYMDNHFFSDNFVSYFVNMNHDDNGIHIHISKKSFDEESLKKFACFVSDMKNRKFIDMIAQRPMHDEVMWRKPMLCHYIEEKGRIVGSKLTYIPNSNLTFHNAGPTNKGASVSTGSPYNTVEFRIFASVQNREDFFYKLEFTDALVRFARSAQWHELTTKDFISYISKNKSKYPILWLSKPVKLHKPKRLKVYKRRVGTIAKKYITVKKRNNRLLRTQAK